MIIGQFIILEGPNRHTVSLDDRWRWGIDPPHRLHARFLRTAFQPNDADLSPSAGTPGYSLLSRAAEFFHAADSLSFFTPPAPALPDGAVY